VSVVGLEKETRQFRKKIKDRATGITEFLDGEDRTTSTGQHPPGMVTTRNDEENTYKIRGTWQGARATIPRTFRHRRSSSQRHSQLSLTHNTNQHQTTSHSLITTSTTTQQITRNSISEDPVWEPQCTAL